MICPNCDGEGLEPDTGQDYPIGNCGKCEGTGQILQCPECFLTFPARNPYDKPTLLDNIQDRVHEEIKKALKTLKCSSQEVDISVCSERNTEGSVTIHVIVEKKS